MNDKLFNSIVDSVAMMYVAVGRDPDPVTLRSYGAGLVAMGPGIIDTLKGITKEAMDGSFQVPPSVEEIQAMHRKDDTTDPKFLAREAAARILASIGRFGWCNPKEARAYMGELAWKVVEMQAGWNEICESTTNQNKVHLQAQWRDLAEAILEKKSTVPPGLPQGDVPGVPSDILKTAIERAGK